MRNALVRAGLTVALLSTGVLNPGGSFASEDSDSGTAASRPPAGVAAPQVKTVTVPSVIDKPVSDASKDLNDVGLVPVAKSVVDRQHRPDTVIAQNPAAGAQVTANSQIILNVAATEIAVQPGTTVDEATGRVRVWGQLVVHRAFVLDLKPQIQRVPLLAIAWQGRDYARGDEPDSLRFAEARANAIAERLTLAWTLLDTGGTLEVSPDEGSIWHLTDPLGPQYAPPEPSTPCINVCHPSLGSQCLKVLCVYPEDALAFGQPDDTNGVPTPLTPRELADYLAALIQAHHLLFHRLSTDPNSYDHLDICKTRGGRIFKEIAAQARQEADGETRGIGGVLEQMSADQATRLATLAYKAPTDWRTVRKP